MNIQVNDFHWEPGKNDAEYIKLLESSRDGWQKIAQKAIAKLTTLSKAQEPRVMTLDEVMASTGKDLILEYRPWRYEDSVVTAATLEGCGGKGVSFVMSVACDYAVYNRKHCWGWRCWTSRPTNEQRKAVKWND